MIKNGMRPVHPGEVLREEFLTPMGLSVIGVAQSLQIAPEVIQEIVAGRRAVTAETAERLAQYFGGDAQSWLNLQSAYESSVVR